MRAARPASGILCGISEHRHRLANNSLLPKRLYGVVKRFKPHLGEDLYDYQK